MSSLAYLREEKEINPKKKRGSMVTLLKGLENLEKDTSDNLL